MKPRLQTSLGQQLVLTPQLRQAIHLLQLSALELEAELAEAVETNPLLDWAEPEPLRTPAADDAPREDGDSDGAPSDDQPPWTRGDEPWQQRVGPTSEDEDEGDAADRVAEPTTLHDHLQWQLHLSHLSPRDRRIGAALIDAIDDDGYLREPLDALRDSLRPDLVVQVEELVAVLRAAAGIRSGRRRCARPRRVPVRCSCRRSPKTPPARRWHCASPQGRSTACPRSASKASPRELQCARRDAATARAAAAFAGPAPGRPDRQHAERHLHHPGLRDLAPAGRLAGRRSRAAVARA